MTRNLLTLIGKELRSLLADPILILLIAYMFTGMVIAMSQSNTDIRNAAVAIIDEDRSPFSRRLADAIRPPYFRAPVAIERAEADVAMNRGDYVFILEIPPNLERDLLQNRASEILLNIDATRMNQGGIGSAYLAQIFAREIRATLNTPAAAPPVQPIIRTRYNPNAENAYQMPVTALGNAILLLLLLLVGAAVIREREHGTIEHLLVMPVTASEIMLAKILANGLVILIASTGSLLAVVHGLIGVPINGSLSHYLLGHHDRDPDAEPATIQPADAAALYHHEPLFGSDHLAQQHARTGARPQRILAEHPIRHLQPKRHLPRRGIARTLAATADHGHRRHPLPRPRPHPLPQNAGDAGVNNKNHPSHQTAPSPRGWVPA